MKLNTLLRTLLITLAFSFILAGCSAGTENTTENNETTIVTSFYPMYIFTQNIVKDIPGIKLENMTEPQQGCLHDYQMVPADLKTLEKADIFVINGAGMEAFLDKVIKQRPSLKIVEASKNIELIKDPNGEKNAHVWVGVSGAIQEVKNIAEGLAESDAKNADAYRKNASEYVKQLGALKEKMNKELKEFKKKDVITFHEAFPYFAKEFGLNIVSVVEREPGTEPSAGELAGLINKIKSTNVKILFAEPQYSAKAAESIAKQTDAKVYMLDPVVTGEKNAPADRYIKTMEENLKVLVKAFKENQ
ncbi:metal ABC transporter substrate-binding protein [Ruminiclostridium cellulolyticum]|uniref:Periplasmic solute binding protein n=1 Tax=Ruminiclostridium cellulolyticum (strain ATCC 35319 / DSM 5812 / JCM 6584 / H10) TaxID=394503 RepID=B8I013_RUMCH|nr:zinc ABC transporter substrate-binding protein [Ruminiclostridium cellulolyticum]ACL75513.1 periplasmic solute binding protein [Ruminiclostridium cellulolyticum H10]